MVMAKVNLIKINEAVFQQTIPYYPYAGIERRRSVNKNDFSIILQIQFVIYVEYT